MPSSGTGRHRSSTTPFGSAYETAGAAVENIFVYFTVATISGTRSSHILVSSHPSARGRGSKVMIVWCEKEPRCSLPPAAGRARRSLRTALQCQGCWAGEDGYNGCRSLGRSPRRFCSYLSIQQSLLVVWQLQFWRKTSIYSFPFPPKTSILP